ncbi:hypothetical protein KSP40_PGU017059 [Platanthera guangdongensis]|uniref:Uncharacterized protein n=1 Tax=Platanthera guangdongensis TaxID=2320717 RepID=A0ABR2MJV1_9ASPA
MGLQEKNKRKKKNPAIERDGRGVVGPKGEKKQGVRLQHLWIVFWEYYNRWQEVVPRDNKQPCACKVCLTEGKVNTRKRARAGRIKHLVLTNSPRGMIGIGRQMLHLEIELVLKQHPEMLNQCVVAVALPASGGAAVRKTRSGSNGFRNVGGAVVSNNNKGVAEATTGSRNGFVGVSGSHVDRIGGSAADGRGKAGADGARDGRGGSEMTRGEGAVDRRGGLKRWKDDQCGRRR